MKIRRSVLFAIAGASLVWCSWVSARPSHLDAWKAKYPTSTLPARMAAITGAECHVCHHPPTRDLPGNCYRMAIWDLLNQGRTAAQAIDELDAVDSDGDGVANGEEAITPRADDPAEIGYNMGLIGPTGTDSCAIFPQEAVTGMLESPPLPVPTISEWGTLAMAVLLVPLGAFIVLRRGMMQTDC